MSHGAGDNLGAGFNAVEDEFFPTFWPGLPQLNVGVKLEEAIVSCPVPEKWDELGYM